MTKIVLLVAILTFLGCTANRALLPPGLPAANFHRLGDPLLTVDESKAISVAHDYLEKKTGNKVDAFYRPKKTECGYDIDVNFVNGYDDQGKEELAGHISSVRITENWKRIEYIRW